MAYETNNAHNFIMCYTWFLLSRKIKPSQLEELVPLEYDKWKDDLETGFAKIPQEYRNDYRQYLSRCNCEYKPFMDHFGVEKELLQRIENSVYQH